MDAGESESRRGPNQLSPLRYPPTRWQPRAAAKRSTPRAAPCRNSTAVITGEETMAWDEPEGGGFANHAGAEHPQQKRTLSGPGAAVRRAPTITTGASSRRFNSLRRSGVRCNNWVEGGGVTGGGGQTPSPPPSPPEGASSSSGSGGGRTRGSRGRSGQREQQQEQQQYHRSLHPVFSPAGVRASPTRLSSPAISEADEPLVPRLMSQDDGVDELAWPETWRNHGRQDEQADRHSDNRSAGARLMRTVALAVGERFIIKRHGKW